MSDKYSYSSKVLMLIYILLIFNSCIFDPEPELSKPDLNIPEFDWFLNPCTGTTDYLKNEFYYIENLGFPYNGYPRIVEVNYRPGLGFFDCYEVQWFVIAGPNSSFQVTKHVKNIEDAENNEGTETAPQPTIEHDFEVVDNTGSTLRSQSELVTMSDISPGQSVEANFTVTAQDVGSYFLNFLADPQNRIDERNETNNSNSNNVSLGKGSSQERKEPSFRIQELQIKDIESKSTPFVIYHNGRINYYLNSEDFFEKHGDLKNCLD